MVRWHHIQQMQLASRVVRHLARSRHCGDRGRAEIDGHKDFAGHAFSKSNPCAGESEPPFVGSIRWQARGQCG